MSAAAAMPPPPPFSARLRAWRDASRLSQDEAAARLGIGRTYYSRLENGRKSAGRFLVEKFNQIAHTDTISAHIKSGPICDTTREAIIARLIQKVLRIEREGTPEQVELLDAAIDSQLQVAERRRREKSMDHPPAGS